MFAKYQFNQDFIFQMFLAPNIFQKIIFKIFYLILKIHMQIIANTRVQKLFFTKMYHSNIYRLQKNRALDFLIRQAHNVCNYRKTAKIPV